MNHPLTALLTLFLLGCAQRDASPETAVGADRSVPSPPLMVLEADSEEERTALDEAYLGVTTDGKIRPDLYSVRATGVSTTPIREAVVDFRASLSATERQASSFPVDDIEWRRWTNIDAMTYKRRGVGLHQLTDEQREKGLRVLRTALSPQGYRKTEDIRKLEGYLARLTGAFEDIGPDHFWFTFMGEPSATEPWGWQLDGHHLVLNYFVLGDQVVMTPTFMGSEPSLIPDGEHAGTRTFEQEEAAGIKLYRSLDANQRAAATLSTVKRTNFNQAESFRDNAVVPYAGIGVATFSPAQRATLEEVFDAYIGNLREDRARVRMQEVKAHLDETYFAWVGAEDASGPFYYRLQSPVILIEFDHQIPIYLEGNQPTKAHVHTVVRTPNGNDYGRDLLRQHLEAHPH